MLKGKETQTIRQREVYVDKRSTKKVYTSGTLFVLFCFVKVFSGHRKIRNLTLERKFVIKILSVRTLLFLLLFFRLVLNCFLIRGISIGSDRQWRKEFTKDLHFREHSRSCELKKSIAINKTRKEK